MQGSKPHVPSETPDGYGSQSIRTTCYDVFLSHAGAQKPTIVDVTYQLCMERGLQNVFMDEHVLGGPKLSVHAETEMMKAAREAVVGAHSSIHVTLVSLVYMNMLFCEMKL